MGRSRTIRGLFGSLLLFTVSCGCEPAEAPITDPVAAGTPLRFTGEIVLTGSLARSTEGAVVITVRAIGGTRPLWKRSYEIADPWWDQRPHVRTLAFGLAPQDAVVDPAPQLSAEMEIVARFDPDGNTETREASAQETVTRARTGATDLVLTLGQPQADLRAGPGISRTNDAQAPVGHPDKKR